MRIQNRFARTTNDGTAIGAFVIGTVFRNPAISYVVYINSKEYRDALALFNQPKLYTAYPVFTVETPLTRTATFKEAQHVCYNHPSMQILYATSIAKLIDDIKTLETLPI